MLRRERGGISCGGVAPAVGLALLLALLVTTLSTAALTRSALEQHRAALAAVAADVRQLSRRAAEARPGSAPPWVSALEATAARLERAASAQQQLGPRGREPPAGGGSRAGGAQQLDEATLLSVANYSDPAAKLFADSPAAAARIVARWQSEGRDMQPLMTPLHRVQDYLMVRDCERKTGGKRGCIDGFVLPEQANRYYEWTRDWDPPEGGGGEATLCETGFNAGHSAVTFLLAQPRLTMHSFDLFIQAYSESALAFVRAVFGAARMHLHAGDSAKSLAAQHAQGQLRCDVLSVDGAHSYKACLGDVQGLGKLLARDNTPILMDDTAEGFEMKGGPAEVWRKLKRERRLRQTRCVPLGVVTQWKRGSRPKPRGFCIGAVNRNLAPFGEDGSGSADEGEGGGHSD
eukprot:TRINITY_DN55562_c0_g1_i1.p1 TRINITY_DN55562_c0_g1~~TRINITY_DN55562_c0_g1_i1.p1  ORF type:complete len:433 (+),score=129.25 TRINITY_DN55562_c0_g1_i1:90-1301(+)